MGTFNYRIEQIDDSEYKLILSYDSPKETMNWLFKKTLEKLQKKEGITVNADPNIIEQFNIPNDLKPVMLPPIHKAVRKNIKTISKITLKDGFKILTHQVTDCIYKRKKGGGWKIEVIIEGTFIYNRR